MKRIPSSFLAAVPLLFSLGAAQEPVVFRSDVSLVRVDTQVLDRDNRAITGLRAEDFLVREQGRPQAIRNFASEDMPLDVLLLLDVSASMRPHVERIASAAQEALRVLREEDRVGIMVFDRSTRLRLPLRNSKAEVTRELESLLRHETFRGGTDITRALLDAAAYVGREGRRDARRAIVILTDDETEFERDDSGVLRALARAEAVLSALIAPDAMRGRYPGTRPGGSTWPGGGDGWPRAGGPIILGRRGGMGGPGRIPGQGSPRTKSAGTAEIARGSGGDSLPVDDAYGLETTLTRLRQRYALHFLLPAGARAGQERSISVELTGAALRRYPDSEVRFRRTYTAPVDGAGGAENPVAAAAGDAPDPVVTGSRRRRAVSDGSTGPRIGGVDSDNDSRPAEPAAAKSGWKRADDSPEPRGPLVRDSKEPERPAGGWRKLKPGEQP